jgi:hypothetical protein
VDTCPRPPYPSSAGWTSAKFETAAETIGSYQSCNSQGQFGVDLAGAPQRDGASSGWSFTAPEGVDIIAVRWTRRVTASAPYVYELTRSSQEVLESSIPGRAPEAAPPNGLWERKYLEIFDSSFTLRVRCEAGEAQDCEQRDDAGVDISLGQVELADYAGPSVDVVLTAGDPAGRPESWTLTALATDLGSGTRSMTVLLDGEPIASGHPIPGGQCAPEPFTIIRPCPGYSLAQIHIPRATVLDGKAKLSVIATDATGGTNDWGPEPISNLVRIERDASIAPTQAPAPLIERPISISASLSGHDARLGSFSKPPVVRGVVRGVDGATVAGATLELSTRPLMTGSSFTALRTVTTDARGEFATRLPAGPSREIKLSAARLGGWAVATLRMIVKAPISIKTNRARTHNGRTVRFIGNIPGAPDDARTRVDLQAWAGRWVPFAAATVRRGRFSAKYTFKRTYRPTSYRFRAVLRDDPNFPYAAATSKEVRVRVIP